jgi:hypothetical protein
MVEWAAILSVQIPVVQCFEGDAELQRSMCRQFASSLNALFQSQLRAAL